MNDTQELYQKLKSYIAKDFSAPTRSSSGSGSGSGSLPSKWPWNKIDFAGSSLSDITYRSHADLSNRDADDHRQYLMQAGREGYIYLDALAQVRDPSGINRRGQFKMDTNGFEISSYDADLLAYKSAFLDGSDIYLRPNGSSSPALYTRVASTGEMSVANDSDTEHHFGRAYVGYTGHADNAAFGHIDWTGTTKYIAMQDNSGDAYFNAPLGRTVYVRNGNVDRLSIKDEMLMYSGLSSFRTDNFGGSQSGIGFKIDYTGAGDFRYLYTNELHAKVFIADLEQALAGLQIIAKSVTTLAETFTAPFPGQSTTLHVKDLPSATGMRVFVDGDTVNIRQFSRAMGSLSIADCWGTVTWLADLGDKTQTWTFTRSNNTPSNAIVYNTIAHRNTQTQSSSSNNAPTVLKPTGTATGDILIATLVFPVAPTSITQPSGFTLLKIESNPSVTMYVWQRIADGSEPSSFVWALGSNINYSAMVTAYSNPYGLFPIDGSNSQSNTSSTSMTAPAVSARSAKNMLLMVAGTRNIRATPPSGMTERADAGSTNAGVYLAELLLSASGSSGTKTATLSTASDSVAALISVAPSWSSLGNWAGAMYPLDTVSPDAIVLDYGISGNGYAEVNAIDGLYAVNSPYYQIVTWSGHPATGKTIRMRLGNLNGLPSNINGSNLTPTGYGLFTDNAYLAGTFVGGGGYFVIDANGAAITPQNDISWSLAAGASNISVSDYQTYSYFDSTALVYFGGLSAGKSTTRNRVMIYNQTQYIDKDAEVIIDARHASHDVSGVVTYPRDSRVILAASTWYPDSGINRYARIDIESLANQEQNIKFEAGNVYVIGNLVLGNPLAASSSTWSMIMPPGGSAHNSGNGRTMIIQAGSTDNASGKVGGNLYLRPGAPVSPATAYGALVLADQGGNIGMFGANSFGGGLKVLSVGNAGTVPASNPTGGGILYAESGAGKWRGSSGTITTFGPAEPHCQRCGRDFALEWENRENGWGKLAICMHCLTKALTKAGINYEDYAILN